MRSKGLLMLLALVCVRSVSCWGFHLKPARGEAPHFSVVPADAKALGQGQLSVLQAEAGKETFLDRLLGTNCYAHAVAELGSDCRNMEQDQKSRLALRLVNCQLATQGDATHPCGPAQPLRQCTDALPDRAYQLYVEFLSHADNMCLFIQNQNFERYTEGMLNKLADGAAYAREQLASLREQAAEQHAHITRQAQEFAARAEESLRLGREARGVQAELLATARGHREESLAYYNSLNVRGKEVLALQEEALSTAGELREGQASLARALDDGSARVESLFSFIDDHARRQLALQKQHEEQQHQLTSELRSLASDTQGLRTAVDVVVRYEQRSDAALIKLLGRSYTLEDAAFYGAGLLGVAATGVMPGGDRARLPLLALLCSSLVGERLLLQRLHMFLELGPADELIVNLPTHLLPLPAPLRHLAPEGPVPLNVRWTLRKGMAALAVLMVLYTVYSHRNYERDSFNMLRRIEMEARGSNAEQQERLARIEQRLAAIQAWERQRLKALALAPHPLGPSPAQSPAREGRSAATAQLLPPGPVLEGGGGAGAAEFGPAGFGPGDDFGAAFQQAGAQHEGALEVEVQQQENRDKHEQLMVADPARDHQRSAPKPRPASVKQERRDGVTTGGFGASYRDPNPNQPKTPASRSGPAASTGGGRKRRGSEETQETERTAGTAGVRRWGRHRLSAAAELPQQPEQEQRQAKRGKRAGEVVASGEGAAPKRTRR